MKFVVLRPFFNRPEMLYVSIESEVRARKYYNLDYTTLFVADHGVPPACLEIANMYPYEKSIVVRNQKMYGWGNILEGFKQIFNDDEVTYGLNIEDDCLLHETYFKYVHEASQLFKDENMSVINASRRHVGDSSVNTVRKLRLFEAPGCIINANFFNKFVRPYATFDYYKNRAATINKINIRNNDDPRSKYRPSRNNALNHVGWDGMVNRLVDTAFMEEGYESISPDSDRQIHIGFYGQNRPGSFPSKETDFMTRVNLLRKITASAESMQQFDRNYKDYKHFSPDLINWDGVLELAN